LPPENGEQNKVIAMRENRLGKMSLKELTALHAKVQAAIDEKRVSERHEMRAKMEDMARASGFSVAEIFGSRRGKGGKVAAKYRNPKDPSQTWTGRGRRPNWMVQAGGDAKRFLIAS
jgi:DNA-binding protein H-NS